MAVVSVETVGTVGDSWHHVTSRPAPIGKVSAIITHIGGKVKGTLTLRPALLICCSTSIQRVAKSSRAGVCLPNSRSPNDH